MLPKQGFYVLLAALAGLVLPAFATETPPQLVDFHDVAAARAQAPADEKKLAVVCQRRLSGADAPAGYEGLWVSFLTATPGRIELVALTKAAITAPADVISLRPRYGPLPTARVSAASTLDWAYVYDRNGDGRIDYLVYLQNAHAFLPEPLPADFPRPEPLRDGKMRVSKELLYAMIEHARMVFRHYADDDFDGAVDAVVVEEFDAERPMFVRGYVAYVAPRAGVAESAWAFRTAIGERRRTWGRDPARGVLLPTVYPAVTEPAAERVAHGTLVLGIFNDVLGRCPAGAGAVERAAATARGD